METSTFGILLSIFRGGLKAYSILLVTQANAFRSHKDGEIRIERKVYSGGGADQMTWLRGHSASFCLINNAQSL